MAQMYYSDRTARRLIWVFLAVIGIALALLMIYWLADRNTESPTVPSPRGNPGLSLSYVPSFFPGLETDSTPLHSRVVLLL